MPKMLGEVASYLTTAEVARSLGLVRATVCLAVKQGRLVPAMKLPGGRNGAYLFTESAVIAWRTPGERLL